jgi:tetratricopeptide (TPR) repeat protein
MRLFPLCLIAAPLAVLTFPATAGITVIGNSAARLCFEAAEAGGSASITGMQRCDEALEREALSERDRVATHVNRGILRMQRGQMDAAIADFDRAMAKDPNEPETYLNKGVALLRKDSANAEASIALFNAALEKRTNKPAIAYYGRAIAHEMGGRAKQAYLDYRQASLLAPKWQDPRRELARFQVRQP